MRPERRSGLDPNRIRRRRQAEERGQAGDDVRGCVALRQWLLGSESSSTGSSTARAVSATWPSGSQCRAASRCPYRCFAISDDQGAPRTGHLPKRGAAARDGTGALKGQAAYTLESTRDLSIDATDCSTSDRAGRVRTARCVAAVRHATVSPRATAHVNTAYFVWNQEFDVFWLSDPAATHSRNIRARRSMAIAVHHSRQVWGRPDCGIQLFGTARQLPTNESAHAESLYAARFSGYARQNLDAYRFYQFRHRPTKGVRRVRVRGGRFRHRDYPDRTAPGLETNGHRKRSRQGASPPRCTSS